MRRLIQNETAACLLLTFLILSAPAIADPVTGSARIGYVFVDDEGNRSINQTTYNTYEGMAVSFEDWRYQTQNGISLTADLRNLTLNNRNLTATARKPGLFSLSVNNSQYRRVYSFDGEDFTRRRSTGVQASVQPLKYVRLFGGFALTDKHGVQTLDISPVSDSSYMSTDYSHSAYSFGTEIGDKYGFVRVEYRRSDLDDNINALAGREADNFTITATSSVPKYDWIIVSGGYIHRKDKVIAGDLELSTNQGWLGARAHFPKDISADYRLLFARTEHSGNAVETDNVVNSFAVSKTWPRLAGVRVGYENRIADDLIDRTVANGFHLGGWYLWRDKLTVRTRISIRSKTVKTGSTLVGDEDVTRHLFSAKYSYKDWATASLSYRSRMRENEDIGSKVDYHIVTGKVVLRRPEYGNFILTHSYYLGKFENSSEGTDYEFSDHVFSCHVYPRSYKEFTVDVGGTYYRSRRNQDKETFKLDFGAGYSFMDDHRIEARYNVFNYDDFRLNGHYYTSNIIEVSIIKDLSI